MFDDRWKGLDSLELFEIVVRIGGRETRSRLGFRARISLVDFSPLTDLFKLPVNLCEFKLKAKGRGLAIGEAHGLAPFETQELLDKGFIHLIVSLTGAFNFLLKKKDDSMRMCISYQGLNKFKVKIPLVKYLGDECLEVSFSVQTWASNEIVVMSFGFTNAPTISIDLINALSSDIDKSAIVFFGDILIYSKPVSNHERIAVCWDKESEFKLKAKGRELAIGGAHRLAPSEMQELLDKGFIHPIVSLTGAFNFLLKKKDDSMRMCISYQGLNKFKVKIPLVKYLGEGCPEVSFLVQTWASNEIVVMPFGFTNAPTIPIDLINALSSDKDKSAIVFFGDILIYSKPISNHERIAVCWDKESFMLGTQIDPELPQKPDSKNPIGEFKLKAKGRELAIGGAHRHRYIVSSLIDMTYWLSE
ncbi:hypothetical protein Tco_0679058 [Tanacetum coccineum]|uniref:Uncharacterized protein n=1 Tax=Tanacetum coccineum TaxID=301880 RepID=A0ABQ4XGT3_9ASTR